MSDTADQAQKVEAILRQRAALLAMRPKEANSRSTLRTFVCEVDGALFGLPVEQLAHVAPFTRPARLISGNRALLGLVGRAGRYFFAYDLARLADASAEGSRAGLLIYLRGGSPAVALRVDSARAIEDVAPMPSEDVDASSDGVIAGYARDSNGAIVSIVNLDHMLAVQNRTGRALEGG